MDILDVVKKDYVTRLLAEGKREDGRKNDEYRSISVEKGVLQSAEGSALAIVGKTQVLAAVKFGVGTPYPDKPTEGVLSTNSEWPPLASPKFETGPPREGSIEFARVVDRGIRSSETLDFKSFYINEEKVWMLYLDLYVLDHDGNLIDAGALAGMAALMNAKMPRYEDEKVISDESNRQLPLKNTVVACTVAKVGKHFLLDPTLAEEAAMEGRVTIATTPEHICAGQKSGPVAVTKDELLEIADLSFKKGRELRSLLEQ
ncbi:Exosome complex component Rrp42 [Candidatus Gugararchaeum adminiculabundum]|nr:Exosome complex component Rrp42 [Candidatus Gugararchaeum adminiculabundum]